MATITGTFNSLISGTLSGTIGTPGPQGNPGPAGPIGPQGLPGVGFPTGGLEGQIIVKASATDYDTVWADNAAETLTATVRNETGVTLTKGTVVYINGSSGNKATVTKASASSEAASSKTFAILSGDILNNQNGQAVTVGLLKNLNTLAFSPGANLWLSTTAGEITQTVPVSPNHAVFLGNATRIHATQGEIEVRIQNGYELGELHDVLLTTPTEGQVLKYDATAGLWKNGTDVGGVAWGGITGTLSAQTDLNTALGLKYDASNPLGFITSAALSGYATESFVTSQGYITSSALSPYLTSATASATYFTIASAAGKANLSGATFTGKVNFATGLGVESPTLNLGATNLSTTATNAVSGDIWISGTTAPKLTYKVGTGNLYCATSNLTNTFSSPQIIDITSATAAALRVTQKGTANAIEVEDSTTPDATRFVVDQHGRVGIGVAPDTYAALKVDSYGIKFGDGTVQVSAANNEYANMIWFAQNYFGAITSWSYDGGTDETTIYHSSGIIDAIAPSVVDAMSAKSIQLIDDPSPTFTAFSVSYGAGYIVFSGDVNSKTLFIRMTPSNYSLPGYSKSFI